MSRLKADRAKALVHDRLGLADDEAFCRLVWAARELQTRGGSAHGQVFVAPPEARTTDFRTGQYAFPWFLETLVNELLTTRKPRPRAGRPMRGLDCEAWSTIARLTNRQRQWEDLEDGLVLNQDNILRAVDRITHQQFHWQRGDLNLSTYYRSGRLFGGERAAERLNDLGFSLNALSVMGLAVYAALERAPYVPFTLDLTLFGVSPAQQAAAMARISLPLAAMRDQARALRGGYRHPAYAPSALRNTPCLRTRHHGVEAVLTPLPELVLSRTNSGVYYDLIGGGAEIRNEIGKRFEDYAFDLLSATVASLSFRREYKYRWAKNTIDSPDLVASRNEALAWVVECKATKMSFDSKFGLDAMDQAPRGFDEIAKGVYQVWRYFAHTRLGRTQDLKVADDALGVVLTLDPWVQVSFTVKGGILDRARALAQSKSPEILEEDMRPVAIYPIENLENLVLNQPDLVILDQVQRACRDAPDSGEIQPDLGETAIDRPYPFADDIGRVLPWWRLARGS
ncbi:MAG TPA: hypothetical protein VN157_07335 [Caulobacter sp.]|nr:hypothetical protein [Caulobacter sp.]